jgi:hypothetical protein
MMNKKPMAGKKSVTPMMPQGYMDGGYAKSKKMAKKPMPSKGMMPQGYKDGGSICGYRSQQDFGK